MNQLSCKYPLLLSLVFLLATVTACDLTNQQEQQQTPQAIIRAEFHEEGTGAPLVEAEISVSTIFNNDGQEQEQGTIFTNENGHFEGLITNNTETVITRLIFELKHNDVDHRFERDVNLQLRTQGEIDRVELSFLVPAQGPEEENGEEEENGNGNGEG